METQQETNGHAEIPSWFKATLDGWLVQQRAAEASRAAEHCSPSITKLAAALSKAQAGFTTIERNREVEVEMKNGGSYTFTYATLDAVLAATVPSLTANGLSLTSLPMIGQVRKLRTLLLHESGEYMAVELPLPDSSEGPQALGKALTYARRYSVTCLLCVAAEEDDDGNQAEGNQLKRPPRDPRQKPEPQSAPGPWRAQGDDGTLILDGEIEDFDRLIKQLGWNANYTKVFLDRRFGIPRGEARQMTRQQFKAVAKLLTANGLGKEKYEAALKEAIDAGQVKP